MQMIYVVEQVLMCNCKNLFVFDPLVYSRVLKIHVDYCASTLYGVLNRVLSRPARGKMGDERYFLNFKSLIGCHLIFRTNVVM